MFKLPPCSLLDSKGADNCPRAFAALSLEVSTMPGGQVAFSEDINGACLLNECELGGQQDTFGGREYTGELNRGQYPG